MFPALLRRYMGKPSAGLYHFPFRLADRSEDGAGVAGIIAPVLLTTPLGVGIGQSTRRAFEGGHRIARSITDSVRYPPRASSTKYPGVTFPNIGTSPSQR